MGRTITAAVFSIFFGAGAARAQAPAVGPDGPPTIATDALVEKLQAGRKTPLTLVDVRSWVEYQDAHIRGSIHIPSDAIKERLPEKVKDKNRELAFYCGGPRCPNAREAAVAAQDLGYRRVVIYQEGLNAWVAAKQPTASSGPLPMVETKFVAPEELRRSYDDRKKETVVVDVRNRKEYADFHLQNSINIPLDELEEKVSKLPKKNIVVVCHAGGQSVIAARLLGKFGRKDVCVLRGGLMEWNRIKFPYMQGKAPSP